jgi:hypothetical protein
MNEINSNAIGRRPLQVPSQVKPQGRTRDDVTKTAPSEPQSLKIDKIEISKKNEESVTYTNLNPDKKLSTSEIDSLIAEADKATENLRKLVEKLILKQTKFTDSIESKRSKSSIHTNNGKTPTIEEVDQAKQAISEDGPFGVKAVSDRLVDFAINVSGGDKTKLAELTSAIKSGFEEARKAFGGELPEICNQTYNETMRKLSDWAQSPD